MFNKVITVFAVSGIIALDGLALIKGINGVALSTAIAALGAIGGYKIGRWRGNRV